MDTRTRALLTVAESKGKWCPESRSYTVHADDETGCSSNRTSSGNTTSADMCLGDRCMFWRWHDEGERPQRHAAMAKATWEPPLHPFEDGDWSGRPQDGQQWQLDEEEHLWFVPTPPLPPRGYCGKAGHPKAALLLDLQIEAAFLQIAEAKHRAEYGT